MKRACPTGALLDLAAGRLNEDEAAAISVHVAQCPACARTLARAEDLARAAAAGADAPSLEVTDALRDRLWSQLAPVAENAAKAARTRAAVRYLARSHYGGLGIAAVVVAVVVATWLLPSTASRQAPLPEKPALAFVPLTGLSQPKLTAASSPPSAPLVAAVVAIAESPPASAPPPTAGHPQQRVTVLHLACGAAVQRAGADVRLLHDDPGNGSVRLLTGTVQVEVPKLPAGARMAVETQEARIEVKGTRFSVTRNPEGTGVRVTEGTVWVTPAGRGRQMEILTAGQDTVIQNLNLYRSGLREKLKTALTAKSWQEAGQLAHRLLETLDEGTEADGLRLQLAAVAVREGNDAQAVALAEHVAAHGAMDLTRQNALVFEANLHHAAKQTQAEMLVWQRYRQQFPQGTHIRQSLERLVQFSCNQTTVEAVTYRQQLALLGGQDDASTELLSRCAPR